VLDHKLTRTSVVVLEQALARLAMFGEQNGNVSAVFCDSCHHRRLRVVQLDPGSPHLWHMTANVRGYGGAQQKKNNAKSNDDWDLPHDGLPCY
jgi:hypothetical protein